MDCFSAEQTRIFHMFDKVIYINYYVCVEK